MFFVSHSAGVNIDQFVLHDTHRVGNYPYLTIRLKDYSCKRRKIEFNNKNNRNQECGPESMKLNLLRRGCKYCIYFCSGTLEEPRGVEDPQREEDKRNLIHLSKELNTPGGAIIYLFNLLFATRNKNTPRFIHRYANPSRTIKIKGFAWLLAGIVQATGKGLLLLTIGQ